MKVFWDRVLRGRVRCPLGYIGHAITMADGQRFTIFRDVCVTPHAPDAAPAVFGVRFRFKGLPAFMNKRLSAIPAPFLVGMAGFRRKLWAIQAGTGEFQGLYEWGSEEEARRYPESFIFGVMTKRARPGSVSIEIIPGTRLVDYVEGLLHREAGDASA